MAVRGGRRMWQLWGAARFLVVTQLVVTGLAHDDGIEDRTRYAEQVKKMFYHGWEAYLEYGFPSDELAPLSCSGIDTWGSYALTMVDTLDTLYILGNFTEFDRAVEEVIRKINFAIDRNVSVFETNIRVVGGLLSAHIFAEERMATGRSDAHHAVYRGELLHMARELADRLLPAFDTPTGIPYGTVNLLRGVPPGETTITSLAGAGTYLIEFGMLSRLTDDIRYEAAARGAMRAVWARRSSLNLVGNHIDIRTGKWTLQDSGIGPNQDSFYEYLLKAYVLFGDPEYLAMFETFYHAIAKHMKHNHWYVDVNMNKGTVSLPWFTALGGFWPGLQTLYGDLGAAAKTMQTFQGVWRRFGFVPEALDLSSGKVVGQMHGYFLRPEMVESTMYLYQATRDPLWTTFGHEFLATIEHSAWTPCGYAIVKNVSMHALGDRMESFYLSETLKYLYLLFDADHPFHKNDFVFSTEAHPFQVTTVTRNPAFWGGGAGCTTGADGNTRCGASRGAADAASIEVAHGVYRYTCPRKTPATWLAMYGLAGQVPETVGPPSNPTDGHITSTQQDTSSQTPATAVDDQSTKTAVPPMWPSTCTKERGFDYTGNDVVHTTVAEQHFCAVLCSSLPACNAFTVVGQECYIKSGATGKTPCGDDGPRCRSMISGKCTKRKEESRAAIAAASAAVAAVASAAASSSSTSDAISGALADVASGHASIAEAAAQTAVSGTLTVPEVPGPVTPAEIKKNRATLQHHCFVIKGSVAKVYWSYKVCFGQSVSQFHEGKEGKEDDATSLGQREMAEQIRSAPFSQVQDIADGIVNESSAPTATPKMAQSHTVTQRFINGAYCTPPPGASVKPTTRRETVAHFFCSLNMTDSRFQYDVSEPQTCEYRIVIVSRLLCGLVGAPES